MDRKEMLDKAEQIITSGGDLEEANKLIEQANAMKALEDSKAKDVEPEPDAATKEAKSDVNPARPPLPDTKSDTDKDLEDPKPAVKTFEPISQGSPSRFVKDFYVEKFGEATKAADQFVKEVYGDYIGTGGMKDYYHLAAEKSYQFGHFLRNGTNRGDEKRYPLHGLLTMAPSQVDEVVLSGIMVGDIKETMIEADDTLGGFIVPEDFRMQVIKRMPAYSVIRPRATVITTSRERLNYPTATGGDSRYTSNVRVNWIDETVDDKTKQETHATWGNTAINVYTMLATTKMSRDLAEDAYFDIGRYLTEAFAEASALDEDEKFLVGSGTGRPEGILQNNTTGGPIRSEVLEIKSGHATSVSADQIIKMPLRLDAQYRRTKRSIWIMNKATRALISTLKNTEGTYYFANMANPLKDGDSDTLRGWQIEESEDFGTGDNYPLLHGDPKGYTIADRVGMSVERYLDGSNVEDNQMTYVMRRRLGGAMTKPWCWVAMQVGTVT